MRSARRHAYCCVWNPTAKDLDCLFQRANARAQTGDVEGAAQDCRAILELAPSGPIAGGARKVLQILEGALRRAEQKRRPWWKLW